MVVIGIYLCGKYDGFRKYQNHTRRRTLRKRANNRQQMQAVRYAHFETKRLPASDVAIWQPS